MSPALAVFMDMYERLDIAGFFLFYGFSLLFFHLCTGRYLAASSSVSKKNIADDVSFGGAAPRLFDSSVKAEQAENGHG